LSNQPANQPGEQSSFLMQMAAAALPVLIQKFTGQKMTPDSPSSNNPETQLILSQVLSLQQQILTTQQAFNQRLVQLETNASHQFTNLVQQVQSIKSIRFSQEKKQIEFQGNPNSEKNFNKY
jgi:hypothetical protein